MANGDNKKHLKGFWPIFILIVVSMVAGGIIYAFAYGNVLQDEMDSSFVLPSQNHDQTPAKTPVKTPVKK
jgi:flagellar basal body-associated protein FliL